MSWYISDDVNNGYPYNTEFKNRYISNWTNNETVRLPDAAWRISASTNNSYPYLYFWFQDAGSAGGEGDIIDTGGKISRNSTPRQGAHETRTGTAHNFDTSISNLSKAILDNCNCYVVNAAFLNSVKTDIIAYVSGLTDKTVLENLSGSNIFNAFVSCRAYPFPILPASFVSSISLLGFSIPLTNTNLIEKLGNDTLQFDFGSVTLGISEAWHLEDEYQIYLPFIGVTNFSPANNDTLNLIATVDILNGTISYILKNADGEPIVIASGEIGIDIPINLSQAIQARNTKANVIGIVSNLAKSALSYTMGGVSALLGAVGGEAGQIAGAGASGNTEQFAQSGIDQITNLIQPKQNNPAYQVLFQGNDNTVASMDMKPKILCRRSTVYNNANGYNTAKGLNNSKYVDDLSSYAAGDLIKCVNYKATNIGLTTAEKTMIENLMNAGVLK